MKSTNSNSIYFPLFNVYRFLAAFSVVAYHIEDYKRNYKISDRFPNALIQFIGPVAVTFFFVLSGFLITYLLLVEKEKNNSISIKKFYLRRIFRIWPLYYFLIIIGIFILPNIPLFNPSYIDYQIYPNYILLMYFTFFANLVLSGENILFIGHTWSIAVEEQFYLVWPWILKYSNKYFLSMFSVIIIQYLFKGLFTLIFIKYNFHFAYLAIEFLKNTRFECMAIGGIGAYLILFYKEKMELYLFYFPLRISIIVLTIILMYFGTTIPGVHNLIYSILFCYIITYSSRFNEIKIFPIFNYFGTISYGIYMYHPIIIIMVMHILKKVFLPLQNNLLFNLCVYMLCFILTILVSSLSYQFLERFFINLKSKFSN